jgi:hypothetical protein
MDIPSMRATQLTLILTSQALFDGGTVVSYLQTVKTWLDANPNEVLTLLFTNPEGQSVSTVWKPAFDTAGKQLVDRHP